MTSHNPTCYHSHNHNKVVHFNKYAYDHICQNLSIYEQSNYCLLHFFWYHEVRGKLKLIHSSYCLYAHPNNIIDILCSTPPNKLHSLWSFKLEFHSLSLDILRAFCSHKKPIYDTWYDIWCHQFWLSCSILIVNRDVVSSTLNVNSTLFVIPCTCFGDYRFTMLQLLSLTKWIFV